MKKKLLIVDDEPNNLQVLRQILRAHYDLIFAADGEAAIAAAAGHGPDLILLDVMMPAMNGYQVCQALKARRSTADIPVIFVTAISDVEDEAHGFDVGAVDYIHKPVSAPVLLRRVETHLSLVRVHELEDSYRQAVFMLGEAGHYNDTDTGAHVWRMAAYACALATAAGWPGHMVERLALAAPLHDTGKIGVPDEILKAARTLTAEEWVIMRQHAKIGFGILSKANSRIFALAAEISHFHHEKWDGSGYPYGLAGDAIPESARIVAVADVFDALTSKRPYKEAWSIEDSIAEIRKGAGRHFEPRLAALFEQILPDVLQIRERWQDKEA
jgi:putative two-component system response regulator